MIGSTLSHYRILALLGAGGMGAVYRAHDRKLERDVALKVLPPEGFADPSARARLLREARTASQLNHPHICTIHEVGEADGQLYIAMELVQGQPLDRLIPPGGMPRESVLRYGAQIADALGHAHEHGVIHRDLKTANVVVTGEGRAKVLDFGLAKRLLDPGEGAPLRPSVTLTATGTMVGTPHYLAPELLRGAKADARSDLWALGVLLYELAVGQTPFAGATMPELCAAILNQPMAPLPERVPAGLRSVIQRCLAKEPGRRFGSAPEVRAALEALESEESAPRTMARPGLGRWLVRGGLALAVVGAAALAGWRIWKYSSPSSPTPAAESRGWKQLTFVGNAIETAISPDGRTVAFVVTEAGNESRVMVQDVTGGEALEVFKLRELSGLRWSPTGSDILVSGWGDSAGGTWLVPRMGGPARRVFNPGGILSLSPDGALLAVAYTAARRIWLTPLARVDTSSINLTPKFTFLFDVDWSPDGKMLLFCVADETRSSVWTMRRDGRLQRKVYEAAAEIKRVRWAPRGGAIYCIRGLGHMGELVKVYVNPDGSSSRRAPRVLISGPDLGQRSLTGDLAVFGISSDGRRLACTRPRKYANLWLWGPPPRGRERGTEPRPLTQGTAHVTSPTLSPDRERVAFLSDKGGAYNVHVLSLAGGASRQVTFMEQDVRGLAWSPDGRSIAFTASDGDTVRVWQIAADGGTPTPFKRTRVSRDATPSVAWWPGSKLLYERPGNRNFNILDPMTGVEHPLVQNDSVGWMFYPAWSPDGKHVAVFWNRLPRGLWVVSAEDSAQRFLLSRYGTGRWADDGKALHYVPSGPPWRLVRITFPQGDTMTLIRAPFDKLNQDEAWGDLDFTADLRRFVYAAGQSSSDIWLLENFDSEVR